MFLLDERKHKTKILIRLLDNRESKHGRFLTKHHPPHHLREICATYLYMANSLLNIDHKVVQERENPVFTPKHTVVITQNNTVVQGFANVIRMYGHKKLTTVT